MLRNTALNAAKLLAAIGLSAAILMQLAAALAYGTYPSSCPEGSCIKIDGSTTVFPIAEVNRAFPEDNAAFANDIFAMTDLGSNNGQQQIMAGTTDIGMSSGSCNDNNQTAGLLSGVSRPFNCESSALQATVVALTASGSSRTTARAAPPRSRRRR